MRILHLADLHLGWQADFLGDKKEERSSERDSLLKRAVDFALDKRNSIHAVLIAGDLFETHRPPGPVVENAVRELKRLVTAGIFLITVPGNHDEITYHDSVYRTETSRWPGILVNNPMPREVARLELDGKTTAFYALAYTAGLTDTKSPLTLAPCGDADRHIGILHGSLDWDSGDRSLPISSPAVAQSGYQYLALGHIHCHTTRFIGKTLTCYTGAVEAKNFKDPGTGMFTVLNLSTEPFVERVSAGSRPCLTREVDLNICQDYDEVMEAVRRLADPQSLMRVILKGQVSYKVETDKLLQECNHLFYYLRVESESVFFDMEILKSVAAEPTIRGFFVQNLLTRMENAKEDTERDVIKRALLRGMAALQGVSR